MTKAATWIVGALLVASGGNVSAHHGYAAFYTPQERTVAVDGVVESVLYTNPHVVLKIRAADATVYTVTWQAPLWLERNARMTKSTLKVGDHLVVIAAPARDPASHEVTMVREVRRPVDGWLWRSSSPFAQPS